jgi:hypothetical protein
VDDVDSLEAWMKTYFAEVLARESVYLARVGDRATLANWRHNVVEELMTPRSPYVLALRRTGDPHDRADFLDRWRELIVKTLDRLLRSSAARDKCRSSTQARKDDVDAQKTAMLILAALHGGGTLSQLTWDPRHLNAALDLALVPFVTTEDNGPARTSECPEK